ncbi:hypothetical protein [Vibrio anguillarum]|uniref:hypothetical protein n=1 Tax=Vibrio anguillarum TaxID=55601 RepID=UPI0013ED046C|nr:hypothetical protein [Vibrio anguillarum]
MQQHKLEQAIAAFDHWRQSRTKRTHTPNELRQLAVELAASSTVKIQTCVCRFSK